MQRREFITLVGGAAVAWPAVATAQPGSTPLIGFLGASTSAAATEWKAAFARRLGELGWIDGRNVSIEYRWAEGRTDRFDEIAAEFVRLKVNAIVTWGTATAVAAKRATAVIPIVFTIVGDPVGSGLVEGLARPGGNVTGLSTQHADTAGKRLSFLSEIVPGLRRVAVMANTRNTGSMLELQEALKAAPTLGLEIVQVKVSNGDDIPSSIKALRGNTEALYATADALFNTNRDVINALALEGRLPTMHGVRELVVAGGLVSYAPNYPDLFQRAGDYVDKVLRGVRPSDIPVEQPTKFDLVLNLKTAKALGITVSQTLIARADEVID
jgi:putative ABC transport system substrate-binding protein